MVSGPPTFISTSSATTTRPWPVCSSIVSSTSARSRAGDDVAVVVGVADLGAVERAGALRPALGVVEHRLGAQLERVRRFDPLGRGEGPIVRSRLGLGPVEHVEQRRPRGEVDAEFAEVSGTRVEAGLVQVGGARRQHVFLVVAERVPEVDGERVVTNRIGIVAWIKAGIDEVAVVPVAVGRGVNAAGERVVTFHVVPSKCRIGAWRSA